MKKNINSVVAVVVGLGLALGALQPAAASTDAGTATISGKVLTSDPGIVPGATGPSRIAGVSVWAKNTKGEKVSDVTDSRGRFHLRGLKPGTYGIKFSDVRGLIPCPDDCFDDGKDRDYGHYKTEWLGDKTSFAKSDKIAVRAGDHVSGYRVLIGTSSRLTGKIFIDGKPAKNSDKIKLVATRLEDGSRSGGQPSTEFHFNAHPGNYRLRVSSSTTNFEPFFIVDKADGNTVFHLNGVDKRTGVRVNITTK
jgi:hypothetical protein